MQMKILSGTLTERTGPTHPAQNPGAAQPSSGGGVIDPSEYAWEVVGGITKGDIVRVTVDFDGTDIDVWIWWNDTAMDERTYANMITINGITGDVPESFEFTADQDGAIAIGIEDYEGDSTTYWLTVDTRVGLEPDRVYNTKTFEIDTYYLLQNQTFAISLSSDTGSNFDYTAQWDNIFIGNYFAPKVTVDTPTVTTGNTLNITWSVTDRNVDDDHYYSLWLSNNDGQSYMLLAQNLSTPFYLWDTTGWVEDSYIVKVRAYSMDFGTYVMEDTDDNPITPDVQVYLCQLNSPPTSYWPADFGEGFSAAFNAGDVPPPTTTAPTTTEPTTTSSAGGGLPLDILLIGLVGGIGVGVVVLLVLFLIRKT